MARFLNPVLGAIDRIFKVEGAVKTVGRIDVENPIQPVLDVSRYAQWGLGQYQGLVRLQGLNNHLGGSTLYSLYTLPQVLRDLGYIPASGAFGPGQPSPDSDFWVWLLSFQASGSTTSLTSLNLSEIIPSVTAYQTVNYVPLETQSHILTYTVMQPSRNYANTAIAYSAGLGTGGFFSRPLPALLYPGSELAVTSVTGAANTIGHASLLWIGRAGTGPPGFA